MTTLDSIHYFDSVPQERRPMHVPLLPGVKQDLLWSLFLTAAVRLVGRLDDCREPIDLHFAVFAFRKQMKAGALTRQEWCDEAMRVLGEFMDEYDQQLAKTREIAERN